MSNEDITCTQASDAPQEPPREGSCTTTPLAGILVHFEGENLRPRPRESAADWLERTRDHRQEVDAERERERREGDPEKAQADWLKRWGFKSSEEADEIVGLSMFERYAAFQKCHRKRAADDSEDPEARNIQPPFKKRKTVGFAEKPQIRLISPRRECGYDCSNLFTKGPDAEQADDIRRAQKEYTFEIERAKKWLVIKAYETSPLEQDPRRITLKQMREDNPSRQTFRARWWARKQFRDDARDPPLTKDERSWALIYPSLSDEESDDEDVYDIRREADDDTGGLWDDDSSVRMVSFSWDSETKEPADRSETPEGGPSPSHFDKREAVTSVDETEDLAAEETLAKRWLAQKALQISPLNPDPCLVTVKHMQEDSPSAQIFEARWLTQKMMKDETWDSPLTEKERNSAIQGPSLDHREDEPIRLDDVWELGSLPDIDSYETPEENASEPLVQEQNVTRKRPASSMDEPEHNPSQSSVKRRRIDEGLQRERPVGWLLDSLGGQRRARRWLAEKAARTSPQDMELTHKNTRILSMEQMAEDYPSEITLWTRWATQKVMEEESEEASREQPMTARDQSPAFIEPGHHPDNSDVPPANFSPNKDTMTDSADPEPSVPTVSPSMVTPADSTAYLNVQVEPTPDLNVQAEATPKPDPFEAIMKRLEDLERVVRETRTEPASQQASSAAPKKKRGLGRPKKSEIVQPNDGERQSITVDEQSDTASEQNTATGKTRLRPRRREQPKADPNGKGKASGGLEPTTLPSQEQEPRPKPGRPRKVAQATAKQTGSTSKPTTKSTATPLNPTSTPRQQRRRGRPLKEELPVKEEAISETNHVRMPTPAAATSTHKMRTRTQSPEDH